LSCVTHKNKLYAFGGITTLNARTNGLYIYNFTSQTLSIVEPSSTVVPPLGSCHSCLFYKNNLYAFGGWNPFSNEPSANIKINDFFEFNFSSNKWKSVTQLGDIPTRRRSHKALVHNGEMFVFGGYTTKTENDLYKFNFLTSTWTLLHPTGSIPCTRSRFAMSKWENKMYILGGFNQALNKTESDTYLNDLFELNLDNLVWTKLGSVFPRVTGQHTMEVCNGCLFIFGGNDGVTVYNDFYGCIVSNTRCPLISK